MPPYHLNPLNTYGFVQEKFPEDFEILYRWWNGTVEDPIIPRGSHGDGKLYPFKHATFNLAYSGDGKQVPLTADVSVGRMGETTLLIASRKPVILNAASVNMVDGIEALREIAGLPSISKAVPVSFVLTFENAD